MYVNLSLHLQEPGSSKVVPEDNVLASGEHDLYVLRVSGASDMVINFLRSRVAVQEQLEDVL